MVQEKVNAARIAARRGAIVRLTPPAGPANVYAMNAQPLEQPDVTTYDAAELTWIAACGTKTVS